MVRAVYPGSFDPITYGHMDVIRRAARMFDEITVAVLDNKTKSPLFSVDERVRMLRDVTREFANVKVDSFSGLMTDYAQMIGAHVSIRGLRAVTDFEYELQIAQTNKLLSKGSLDTVFLTTSMEYSYLSSSAVKEIAMFGGDITPCVPAIIRDAVEAKYMAQGVQFRHHDNES